MGLSKKWIYQRRMELMSKTSDAEKAAYTNITRLGYEVVRQKPVNTGRKIYFADLYIPKLHCIIEIDGGYHTTGTQKRKDKNRSQGLWRLGYHVLRLSNHDARNLERVRAKIVLLLKNCKR